MRLNLQLLDLRSGRTEHAVLRADPETPVAELVSALAGLVPGEPFVRGSPLGRHGRLADSALLDGDVVTFGFPATPRAHREGLELAVVGGPHGGASWPLRPGTVTVGRSATADIRLEHHTVSRIHCRLTVTGGTCVVEDLGSTNGTWVACRRLTTAVPVAPGQVIEVGACLLEVRSAERADADLRPDEAGGRAFNRPARIRQSRAAPSVTLPGAPGEREAPGFQWAQVVTPLAVAAPGAVIFGPLAVVFALTSAAVGATSSIAGRRRETRRAAREADRYRAELAEAEARILELAQREVAQARLQFPDPAALRRIATGPTRRLWERRAHDDDALVLRVGVAEREASVTLTTRGGDRPPEARKILVPVAVDLAEAGVLGVAAPPPSARAAARWLLAQLAALRSPTDLRFVLLTDADAGPDWEWCRWLPHFQADELGAPAALVGNDRATRDVRVKELLALLDARQAMARDDRVEHFTPSIVVLFDGIRALRTIPGVPRLLRDGPAVGLYAIGLDTDVTRLAEEGRAQLVVDGDDPDLAALEVDGAEEVSGILFDRLDAELADELGRALAPIRDAGGEEGTATIPATVRF
ncbi:MAG TPA: FHA domain-containing protein, partial [Acidimicrobiales bacterium]